MTTNMNEMEVYMMTKPALATNTKKTYHKNYSNLLKLLGSDDVHSIDPQEIIRDVKTIANPNTQNMYITISIMLKAFFGKSTSQLLKHRDLIKENIKTRKNKNKDMKKDSLPDYEDLKTHTKQLLSEDDLRGYIINYILVRFNTRNMDLDMVVTDDMANYRALGKRGGENVLYVGQGKNGKNYYYRNKYKTKNTHGAKAASFYDVKFNRVVKGYMEQEREKGVSEVYLLALENGERIGSESNSHYITKYTLDGMTESDYNKISVSRVKSMEDYGILKTISENRGTSIPTLIEEYSLSVKV